MTKRPMSPMPQIRAMIALGMERIKINFDVYGPSWAYPIRNEFRYSGYRPDGPEEGIVTYIKKEIPSNRGLWKKL